MYKVCLPLNDTAARADQQHIMHFIALCVYVRVCYDNMSLVHVHAVCTWYITRSNWSLFTGKIPRAAHI